ncbi:hypothetical protein [Streptacidiphilus neutrinimicus]|uniref:hypothetical protein n=1 Tax=Streptacidiphilus neutrinimicus TaxID=105420 RepID=UPI000693A4A5|nr:hypothetical protein [Streptacidiphilus neutrinimicus]
MNENRSLPEQADQPAPAERLDQAASFQPEPAETRNGDGFARRTTRPESPEGTGTSAASLAGRDVDPALAPDPAYDESPKPPVSDRPLIEPEIAQRLRDDWQQARYDFVDDPRQAVERADAVVARAAEHITEALLARSADIRQLWQADEPGSAAMDTGTATEQLRVALQRYQEVLTQLTDL